MSGEIKKLEQATGKKGMRLAHGILVGEYPMSLKRCALRKIDELMGMEHDPPRDTEADVEAYIRTAKEMEG